MENLKEHLEKIDAEILEKQLKVYESLYPSTQKSIGKPELHNREFGTMKGQAYAELGKYLGGELISHKGPVNGVYGSLGKDEEVWLAYPKKFDRGSTGVSPVVVISKKTGKIIANGMR